MERRVLALVIAVVVSLIAAVPAQAASSKMNAYRVKATAKNLERLAMAGFDVTEGRRGRRVEIYGSAKQIARLRRKTKVRAKLVRDRRGRTTAQRSQRKVTRGLRKLGLRVRSSQLAADPTANASDAAYKVYGKYDAEPNDGKEQYTEFYNRIVNQHPNITEKVKIGESVRGRDIIAIQVTQGATGAGNGEPAVLYNSMQHAREWLAGETCKRTLEFFTKRYGEDRQVTRLVNTRQLWFVCVNNPDGYEYTFTPGNRLWRKNLRDNNGDGQITSVDGVDPNRNFPVDWGLDNEGSSPDPSSETFRGEGPASEPETDAMLHLWNMVDFEFEKNDHTAAQLILYPQGWQQYTPAADDPIFTALAGDDEDPAIPTFDPDLGAELYITNGDTLDTAYNQKGILAYTPEGSLPIDPSVSGFEYEDTEGLINTEWVRHRNFSIDLAESADDPANPDSHLGNTVENFYVDSFPYSYGDPQPVQTLAKFDAVELRYRINGGPVQSKATEMWNDGQRYYQEAGEYYHRFRGEVTGTQVGDRVEVWFKDADSSRRSESFTYNAVNESGNRVLVLAAEDYSGPTPGDLPPGGPNYLQRYTDALAANGFTPDVYNVDAADRSRTAPHPLGVLSHYDARRLVHRRRLPDPRAGSGAGHRHVAARARRDHRRARLPQRGRQARHGRQAHRPAVLRGLRVPEPRIPAAQREQARRVVRRAAAGEPRRLHPAHGRLLPVLHGVVPACGGRRLVGRRDGRRPAGGRSRAVQRHLDAERPGRRSGRWGADRDACVDVVARHRPRDRVRRLLGGHRRVVAHGGGTVLAAQRDALPVLRAVGRRVHASPPRGGRARPAVRRP